MKKKSIIISITTIVGSILSSVAIYAFNLNNLKLPTNSLSNSAALNSYDSSIENNYSSLSPLPVGSFLEKENTSKSISINNGFQNLTEYNERLLYNKIKNGADKILDEKSKDLNYCIAPIIISNCRLEIGQIKKVICAIENDHPEIFWISKKFRYAYTNNQATVLYLESTMQRGQKEKAVLKLKSKVSEIISKMPSNTTEYERELFLHDYIVNNCSYKIMKNNPNIFNAYGCLVDKVAVCEGYSRAMQLLLSTVGVESQAVSGARGKELHMWNIVKIGGNWYHLDVTWDNTGGEFSRYDYFNVDDKTIKYDHVVHKQSLDSKLWQENIRYNFVLPVCNGKTYNFYERNALKYTNSLTSQESINWLVKLATNKKRYFYIKADDTNALKIVNNQYLSKIHKFLSEANKVLREDCKFDTRSSISYSTCRTQNVLIIKLNYKYKESK